MQKQWPLPQVTYSSGTAYQSLACSIISSGQFTVIALVKILGWTFHSLPFSFITCLLKSCAQSHHFTQISGPALEIVLILKTRLLDVPALCHCPKNWGSRRRHHVFHLWVFREGEIGGSYERWVGYSGLDVAMVSETVSKSCQEPPPRTYPFRVMGFSGNQHLFSHPTPKALYRSSSLLCQRSHVANSCVADSRCIHQVKQILNNSNTRMGQLGHPVTCLLGRT